MASISGARVNLFSESFLNESEQDANSVLTELDKGLRSPKIGVQCEAIVRFPRLFEKYPFPILINSSFLKLAEFFMNGSNLLRFWVLRVCQHSENHLDKILNVETFMKRIFIVIHCNDPVARALTLRVLGAVARIIQEKQQIHHAIRKALDSHYAVEVEAAIFASSHFAAQSRTFAISMCSKISDMIESLMIPVEMKLQLIPVLRHMYHDAKTASMVKDLCLSLLPKYPSESFIVSILDTLTQLYVFTLTGVPEQVDLLMRFLNDERKSVRQQTLRSLNTLAEPGCVHAWPKNVAGDLTRMAGDCQEVAEKLMYLRILLRFSEYPLTRQELLKDHRSAIVDVCLDCLCMDDFATATKAMAILSVLVTSANRNGSDVIDIMEVISMHMEGLIICTANQRKSENLRDMLLCGVRIGQVNREFGLEMIYLITDILTDEKELIEGNSELMANALAALCSTFMLDKFLPSSRSFVTMGPELIKDSGTDDRCNEPRQPNIMLELLPLIIQKLNAIADGGSESHLVKTLVAVVLQMTVGCFVPHEVLQSLDRCGRCSSPWTQYRMARSASRYGQHFLAVHIFSRIAPIIALDKLHFFVKGLVQMSKAECVLSYGLTYETVVDCYPKLDPCSSMDANDDIVEPMKLMQRLEVAIDLYWQASASVRASSSPAQTLQFQLDFLKHRARFLQVLRMAVIIKNAQVIVPPPAIASTLASNSRDYLQKFGHITNQLRKLVKAFRGCAESYSRLYKTAFDADPSTLEFLEIAEYQCALLAHIVETICYVSPSEAPNLSPIGRCPETRYFIQCCHKMEALHNAMPKEPANAKTITSRHLEMVLNVVDLVAKTPICMPRFFYQILQATHIKLSISPQPRTHGEPVLVQPGHNVVIKIEGVIQHAGKKQSLYRSVDSVQLMLTSQMLTPPPSRSVGTSTAASSSRESDLLKLSTEPVTQTQTVKPQREFLSCNFLLPLSGGGQWQVTMETFVIDESGITWCTGPRNSMIVRVLDDPSKASSTSQSGQSRRF